MTSPARLSGLALLAALLAWAVWEARWTPGLPPPPEPVAGQDIAPAPPAPPAQPLADYPVTLARPLFYPGRHLPDAAPEQLAGGDRPGPVVARQATRPTLTAVIEEHGERSALLIVPGQVTSTRLRPGESLGEWRLVSIDEESVTVEHDGRREEIPLRRFDAAPPPPRQTTPQPPARPRFIRPQTGNNAGSRPE